MKFNVIVITRKNLIKIIICLVSVLALLALILGVRYLKTSKDTFSLVNSKETSFKEDFNGDGSNDVLYIKTNDDKYFMELSTGNLTIPLTSKDEKTSLGKYDSLWPMKITFLDADRNRIPEIYLQSSENNIAIQHIFLYDDDTFKDLLCTNNNVLGFLDYNNGKTPKIISGSYSKGTLDLGYYVLKNKTLKNYSFNSDALPGGSIIKSFILYMESLPYGEGDMPNIFFSGLSGNALSAIGKISAESMSIKFEDGYFHDTKWNKNGEPSEIIWTINLKNTAKTPGSSPKNYTLNVILNEDTASNNQLRISAIYEKK